MWEKNNLVSVWIMELTKCRDQSQDVHICVIDYEKAFDRVKHTELINLLCERGVDQCEQFY